MTAAIPTDPAFYTATAAMATRLDSKAEDLLWVWASETGFDPTLAGASRTISTLMKAGVVPSLLTQAEWDSLPTLSVTDQLPFIERYYKLLHDRYLGNRGFKDTFEAYLANAAPGMLRYDGAYNAASTMYGDPNQPAHTMAWTFNWPMDNYPKAQQTAAARGVQMNLAFAQQLVSEGLLKGWITLGDLKNFMMRADVSNLANQAITQLHSSTGVTKASFTEGSSSSAADGSWSPNFDQSFSNPNAPIDTRVAPSTPTVKPLFSGPEIIVIAGVVYFGLRWFGK